jgi:hypothetical protein
MDSKETLRAKWDAEHELSERLAVALGWSQPGGHAWQPPHGWGESIAEEFDYPLFARDPRACAEAEAEIARRGLAANYTAHLWLLLELGHSTTPESLFLLLTAPLDVRVRAMLAVLGEG